MSTLNTGFNNQTFWSVEPMLEGFDYNFLNQLRPLDLPSWIICGGESGTKKRPFSVAWAQALLRFCRRAEIPFFMKQIDKKQPIPGYVLVREFPWNEESLAV